MKLKSNVGDEVITEIDGIGRLMNTIVADETWDIGAACASST